MPGEALHVFPPAFDLKDCRYGRMLYPKRDRYLGRGLALYGEFSEGEVELFRQFMRPGMTVLDIGANIGAHTVFMARAVAPGGMVLAFEPQRILHQILCANCALNGIDNVLAEQVGLGAAPGILRVPPMDYGSALSFGGLSLQTGPEGEAVGIRRLDAYHLQACAFIKIDVEGMEAQVLEGAVDTLDRLRPVLYVENDRRDQAPALIELLQAMDYRLWWHTPPLYNPGNFAGNPEDVFPGIVSINVLALPRESEVAVEGLRPVTGPEDWYQD
jgi:FkbM family methyltransferase